ncbi:TPA: hypothetical protein ACMVTQ_002152 [Clostridioides difficile]|uniref:hypothetical protein n=1 Tax=Clostridioides difficile TaxID=1496 RepID=UPI00038D9A92|nr:hypothetical protein [Clostridioides difficile]EQH16550.1 hypothetical protein QKO_0269 [Clostridioides difficile DA00195]MCB4241877.1 hypothetical protein [Clostridioides difficile]MCG3587199.1 hypothetical protein [Clostridioides difficile]MCI4269593.1 hypothetical protein [Clostridioides difficile]MCK8722143.1 hypothetical protein [Clostridioides difficile]
MKYTILGFSQKKAVELGLNTKDLLILRWFVDFLGSGRMARKLINGIEYYWVDYSGVIKELPILYTEKHDTIYRVLKKLDKIGILEHATLKQGGTWSYYKLGYRYIELISDSYQQVGNKSDCSEINPYPSDKNPYPSDKNPYPSDKNPTQTDINPERKTHPLYPSTIPCNQTSEVEEKKRIIEEMTQLKISKNMYNIIKDWDIERLLIAIEIYKECDGKSFKYLKTVYNNDDNFRKNKSKSISGTNKNKFRNFDETFTQYTNDELDEIIKKSQKEKFS